MLVLEDRRPGYFASLPGKVLRAVLRRDPGSAGRPAHARVDRQTQTQPLGLGTGVLQGIDKLGGEKFQPLLAQPGPALGIEPGAGLPGESVHRKEPQFGAGDAGGGHLLQFPRDLLLGHDVVEEDPEHPGSRRARRRGESLPQRCDVRRPVRVDRGQGWFLAGRVGGNDFINGQG